MEASARGSGHGTVRLVTVHGHVRAYRMVGEGPPLLLLHGIGDSSRSWVPLLDELARDHTVIAPDLLGHGASAKPRADYSVAAYANGMRDLLDLLEVERATVVGHSLGGGVAAQLAYQYPERCERLVLVASGGVAREVNPALQVAAAPLAEAFLPALSLPAGRALGWLAIEALRLAGTDVGRDADELHRIANALPDRRTRVAFIRTLRSVVDWRGQVVTMLDRCYLAEDWPVLLVWGTRDGVIPVAHAHLAHEAMPGSRLVLVDGAGHFPHHHDPDRFVAELRSFVADTEPAAHEPGRRRQLLRRDVPERAVVTPAT